MNIIEKVKELELAKGEYVVVGGGVLVALGLLPWDDDIDIAVTPQTCETFKKQGWKVEQWQGKEVIKRDVYDVGVDFWKWSLGDLSKDALWIKDIPFMSLPKLLEWKKQMGREKDQQHIKLIEEYLAKHP